MCFIRSTIFFKFNVKIIEYNHVLGSDLFLHISFWENTDLKLDLTSAKKADPDHGTLIRWYCKTPRAQMYPPS